MKKYSEYLNEKYTPLTRDELTKLHTLNATLYTTSVLVVTADAAAADHEWVNESVKEALTKALDEIMFLRKHMALAYQYIGRRAPNPATTAYREVMHHATRIRSEEVSQ